MRSSQLNVEARSGKKQLVESIKQAIQTTEPGMMLYQLDLGMGKAGVSHRDETFNTAFEMHRDLLTLCACQDVVPLYCSDHLLYSGAERPVA